MASLHLQGIKFYINQSITFNLSLAYFLDPVKNCIVSPLWIHPQLWTGQLGRILGQEPEKIVRKDKSRSRNHGKKIE